MLFHLSAKGNNTYCIELEPFWLLNHLRDNQKEKKLLCFSLLPFWGRTLPIGVLPFFLSESCVMTHLMNSQNRIRVCLALAILLIASVSLAAEPYQAKVVGISDGDTIKVLHEGKQVKIRFYGIDTPEKRQAFGNKAKQFTSGRVFGKTVKVIPMDTDRYGRTVAMIQSPDQTVTLNEALVRQLPWSPVTRTGLE